MKRHLTALISMVIIFLLLQSDISLAALKPIAAEVKQNHDLGISFRNVDLFLNEHEISNGTLREALSSGTSAEINSGKLLSLYSQKPNAITLLIPFHGRTIPVELIRIDLFTGDFSAITGNNKVMAYAAGVYYRGIVKGDINSLASFSFFNNEFYGTFSDNTNGNVVVGRVVRGGNTSEYIIYSDKNLSRGPSNYCKTNDSLSDIIRLQHLPAIASFSRTTNCVRLYYEIDHDIYLNNGSDFTTTVNWITAVHNNVATLYANDNINVALSQVYVWTTPDPYTGANSGAQLNLFHSTRVSFNGDVGQLVAIDGGYGGVAAQVNGLCSPFNYSYADVDFTYLTVPTYSWTVEVITHEFGHLLGSAHTHNCNWPGGAIDDCGPVAGYPTEGGCPPGPTPVNGGTIMSYCHLTSSGINFNNGFGPYPAAAIQGAVDSASCLGVSCTVCRVPTNDECSSPVSLGINSSCVYTSGSLCGATESLPPLTCGSGTAVHGYDIWYKVIPSQTDITVTCKSGSTTDIVLAIYSGSCGSLSLVDCSDATITGGIETLTTTVTPGTPYFIRVYDFQGNTTGTDFGICVTQNCITATNNNCTSAILLNIDSLCNNINGDLCSATESMNPTNCSGATSSNAYDLWYKIVPTQSNVHIESQSGQATDIVLGIYSGLCNNLSLMQCADLTGYGGTESLDVALTIGTTYYIRVYDYNSNLNGTDFQLCVKYLPCSGPNPPTGITARYGTVCNGVSDTLTVSGTLSAGESWHWYKNSCGSVALGTDTFIVVTPSATTTYYVRAEKGTCYSSCISRMVNVIQIPANPISITSVPTAVCLGDAANLSVNGTLSSGATWHWYLTSCGGTAIGSGAGLQVHPVTATTYYVRAENGSCYSNCINKTVTILPLPNDPVSASASLPLVCNGNVSVLTVNGTLSSGASWHWYMNSCGGVAAGTGVSDTISANANATWYVRAETANCHSNCASVSVNVRPVPLTPFPIISTSANICFGESVILSETGSPSPGGDWFWYADSCGGNSIGQGSALPVSPLATRSYFVRVEDSLCHSSCRSVTINVNPIPAPPVININNGVLSVSAYSSYEWYRSPDRVSFIASGSAQQENANDNEFYYVFVTDLNGCTVSSDTILYQDPNDLSEHGFPATLSIYPNPFENVLNIKFKSKTSEKARLKLFDDTGRLIYSGELENDKINFIDLSEYASGIYQLLFSINGMNYPQKILKK